MSNIGDSTEYIEADEIAELQQSEAAELARSTLIEDWPGARRE